MSKLSNEIRTGKLNPNMQELFFKKLVKAMLQTLEFSVRIHGKGVPHIIMHTGDDRLWLAEMDYDYSKEPENNTNTQSTYMQVPRCMVQLQSMDIQPDQLSNPHSFGVYEIEKDGELHTITAEFQRMPLTIGVQLTYILNSFTEVLELMQYVVTRLSFIRTFKFTYMGQTIINSYQVPTSLEDEHQTELDGMTQDERNPMVNVSLEIQTNMPVYEPKASFDARLITTTVNTLRDEKTGARLDVRLEHGGKRRKNPDDMTETTDTPEHPINI